MDGASCLMRKRFPCRHSLYLEVFSDDRLITKSNKKNGCLEVAKRKTESMKDGIISSDAFADRLNALFAFFLICGAGANPNKLFFFAQACENHSQQHEKKIL